MGGELPTGVVAFLLLDVEGSTVLWQERGSFMHAALDELSSSITTASGAEDGFVLKQRGEGDSHFVVFDTPSSAVRAAVAIQRRPGYTNPLPVRAAVHLGEIRPRHGDYHGTVVNTAARLRDAGHGGQILASPAVTALVGATLGGITFRSLGEHRLRGVNEPMEILQVCATGLHQEFPPLRTVDAVSTAVMTIVATCPSADVAGAGAELATRALRAVADEHAGRYFNVEGDRCIVAFEDPRVAVAFARAVADDHAARSAVHAGLVEVEDGKLIGSVVAHTLTRLAEAERGVSVSQVVRALLS